MSLTKLLIAAILIAGLVVVLLHAVKLFRGKARGGAKPIATARAFAYAFAATWLIWHTPNGAGGGFLLILGFLAVIMTTVTILIITGWMQSRWKVFPAQPWGATLPRWFRRGAFLLMLLFVGIASLVGVAPAGSGQAGVTGNPASTIQVGPVVPSTTDRQVSPSASAPAASPSSSTSSCKDTPAMQQLATPRRMGFGTDLEVCLDGQWQPWSATGVSAPSTADALAISDKVGNYTYLSMMVSGKRYTIRTLFYKAPGS